MTGTHTTPALDQAPEAEAALERFHRSLVAEGISPKLIQRTTGESEPLAETADQSPTLVIYRDAGWRVATVAVGRRSGMYIVDLAQVGPDNGPKPDLRTLVPPAMPHRAVRLVAHACGVGAL
ncbi:hypothetical protein [Nonomuraea longicatena]|uniref:Uncharacterized protein n=1 Tax=Nonomuraea longicatena TaxID=83682 RepID=A0ABN1NYA0_9ACTN